MFVFGLALILSTSPAHALSTTGDPLRENIKISRAYRDGQGGMIVEFASAASNKKENPVAFADNLFFYCKENRCDQLSEGASGTEFNNPGEKSTTHFKSIDGSSGSFIIDTTRGRYELNCNGSRETSALKPALKADIDDLQEKLRSGAIDAHGIPDELRRVEYVFKKGDEVVYVDNGRYRYSPQTVRVFVGKKGDLRQLKVTGFDTPSSRSTLNFTLEDGRHLSIPTKYNDPKKMPKAKLDGKALVAVKDQKTIEAFAPKEARITIDPELRAPCVPTAKKNSNLRDPITQRKVPTKLFPKKTKSSKRVSTLSFYFLT